MRVSIPRTFGLAVVTGLCLSFGMFAANVASTTTVNFQITGDPDGAYTDPYTGIIGAKGTTNANGAPTGATVPIICDDYADHVSVNEDWTALDNDLSLFASGTTVTSVYFNGGSGKSQSQEYIAAAYLALEVYQVGIPFGSDSPVDNPVRDDLSSALWALFEPSATPTLDASAQTDLNNAFTATSSYTTGASFEAAYGIDVNIYSATNGPSSTTIDPGNYRQSPGNPTAPQEYITVTQVPESSSWAALGFELAGAGFIGLFFRRRQSRI